jgi:hypothetical protein
MANESRELKRMGRVAFIRFNSRDSLAKMLNAAAPGGRYTGRGPHAF